LSTISDDGIERVNINKLKAYHDNNPLTNVIIMAIIVDAKCINRIANRNRKKPELNLMPWLGMQPRNLS